MTQANFTEELALATQLAREAGRAILKYYTDGFEVTYKDMHGSDPVTGADKHANQIIVDAIAQAFPDDAILAEESPPTLGRGLKRRVWCIDPLDGTREFIDHNGQFVVMIGLAIEGRAVMGVVYQPTEDMLYAGAGEHAYKVHPAGAAPQMLKVSTVSRFEDSRLMVSRSHRSRSVERVAQSLGIQQRFPMGSVGLKVGRLCEGTADIYTTVSTQTHEWDACAPEAILRAAGGLMTDTMGRPLIYNKVGTNTPFGLLATNAVLHESCVQALAPVVKERGWAVNR